MAGHSKWKNIQHRKARQDAKKEKLFSRMLRELVVATRIGGSEPENNPRLRTALDKALAANLSRDNINRAIARGAGSADTATAIEEVRYEGYGPGGVAFMVDCMTDNKNRTVSEVRHAFTKFGGSLAVAGAVSYLFKEQGLILTELVNEELIYEQAALVDALNIEQQEDQWAIYTEPTHLYATKQHLQKHGIKIIEDSISYIASSFAELSEDEFVKFTNLYDMLDELDDVQAIYTNAE